jgi:hypothetical protein
VLWSLPLRLTTTLDAGELFGVSNAEPANDASVREDSTVDTESRSLRFEVSSSTTRSISPMSCSRSDTFCRTSCCIRRISPFTVDLCFISISMSSKTRLMEGG